jgi:hypothetical protein
MKTVQFSQAFMHCRNNTHVFVRGGNIFVPEFSTRYRLNLFQQPVSAGFPSPCEDHLDGKLDLNRHYIKNPSATFFVRVSGDSMTGAGIHNNDLLIVDRSLEPTPGKVVIAVRDLPKDRIPVILEDKQWRRSALRPCPVG